MLPPDITGLLRDLRAGKREAEDAVIRAVYPELQRIARRHLRAERPDHSLQASDLVNEAYLHLVGQLDKDWQNRSHFFAVAAQSMRRILVDYARARHAQKRAGGRRKLELTDTMIVSEDRLEDILAVDAALTRLAQLDQRQCRVVELRYFSGLTEEEVSGVLGVAVRTVKRDWNLAKAWLYGELRSRPPGLPAD